MNPMIRCENVCKKFGDLELFKGLDLTVMPGEIIAIIGPSGCGKSSFLRTLEMLEKPDSGKIFIGDDEITAHGANIDIIRRKMGMVYQNFHLFSHLDVLENITLAPMLLKKISREEAEKKALELLREVGLESKKFAMPSELSGGQKQRIAIARSLAMEPDVMLFDEPTSALDPSMTGEVLAAIRILAQRKMTMLIVTHEMEFAHDVANRILYFDKGGICEDGTPDEIFNSPKKKETIAFIRRQKHFNAHIDALDFDLLRLKAGIITFCTKYGIVSKNSNRLQLCAEELVYEIINSIPERGEEARYIDLSIEYSQAAHLATIEFINGGTEFNPLTLEGDTHLGMALLRRIGKNIEVKYEDGKNSLKITL